MRRSTLRRDFPPLSTMIAHILSKNLAAFGERRGNLQSRERRHGGRVASGAAKSGKRNAPPFSLCTNRRSAAHGKKFCRLKTFFVNYCNNQNARPKTTLFGKRPQFAVSLRLNSERVNAARLNNPSQKQKSHFLLLPFTSRGRCGGRG